MLDSGYQAFNDLSNMLLYEVATFLPNLMKIDPKLSERHKFFVIRDGGSRHVEVRPLGVYRYQRYVVLRSHTIATQFGENWSKYE